MIYQQGTQRIEVIVKKEAGVGQEGAREVDSENISASSSNERIENRGGDRASARIKRIAKTNLTHSLAVAKQVFDLGIEYYIGGLGMEYGDQSLQDSVQRQVEIVKDSTNVASSIAMGALYGSWGGPVGAVLGASFGAISTGASIAAKYANRERDYNYKVFKENNAIEYQRARASINMTTGRLR